VTEQGRGRAHPAKSEILILSVLGLFMMTAPASTDMYLPALVMVGRDLRATPGEIQLTLAYFFLGFASGQLVWGALSDRYGRRLPMAAGILLYIFGSTGCALATDVDAMNAWRFVEAFGGCAMPVIAQAMARDIYGREGSARALSLMLLVMAIAPIASPLLGALVLHIAHWRVIFWILAAFGILALAGLVSLPESLPRSRRATAGWGGFTRSYWVLLRDARFLGYALSSAAMSGAAFAYITGTPFVYMAYFGLSPQVFGLLFGLNIVGMASMTLVNSRIVGRHGYDRPLRFGMACGAFFAMTLALLQYQASGGLVAVIVLLLCFMSARGFVTANAVTGALAHHPERTGAASALAGFFQFGAGYLSGIMLNWMHDGTPRAMTTLMAAFALAALAILLVLTRRVTRGEG
jgi:DHA1 family bicyclomycin/chloramphenicol resistance-like MFS transporter